MSFGLFLPLKGIPHLSIFTAKTLKSTLRQKASKYLAKKIMVKDNYNLIVLPQILKWYNKDFILSVDETPTLFQVLSYLRKE